MRHAASGRVFRCTVTPTSPGNAGLSGELRNQYPVMRPLLSRMERRSEAIYGTPINYAAAYWTPPMTPKLAFNLESEQIEKLDLAPMYR